MKLTLLLALLIAIASMISCRSQPEIEPSTPSQFVLAHVNIVDVAARQIRHDQNVYVQSDEIVKITSAQGDRIASDWPIIEGRNGFITPGLIDMHVHMYEKAGFALALSHGVTHVRIMNGIPAQLRWRDELAERQWAGATATVSSPIISAYEGAYLHHTALTPQQARHAVDQYYQQGYDLIKAYGNLSEATLRELVTRADELGMPVAKHGPHGSGQMDISELSSLQSFEHTEDIFQGSLNHQFEPYRLKRIIEALHETQVPVTPTLNIYHQLVQLSDKKQAYLDQIPQQYTSTIIAYEAKSNQVKRWLNASPKMATYNKRVMAFLQQITKRLHQADIDLLVGSDSGVLLSPHGIATHTEMRLLQGSGLTAFDVLQAATLNPAKALGMSEQLGAIEVGYRSDFVYTQTNPITDLSVLQEPDAVVKLGTWYNRDALLAIRDSAIAKRSLWSEIKNLYPAL